MKNPVMHKPSSIVMNSNVLKSFGDYTRVFCTLLSIGTLLIFLNELLNETQHPLYSATSLAEIFIASLVMLYFSLQRSIVHLLLCVFTSIWYTLRVFVIYLVPQNLEYSAYQSYTQDNIELATRYFMFFSLALLLASVLHAALYPSSGLKTRNTASTTEVSNKISFFGIRVDFLSFLRYALVFTIFATFFRIYAFASDLGIRVGAVYQPDDWLLRVAQSLSYPFYPLAIFVFCLGTYKLTQRLSIIIIGLMVIDGILSTSRGWLFGLMANYVVCASVLNLFIAKRTKLFLVSLIPVGLFLVFPAMTVLRPLLLAREYFSFADYFKFFLNNMTSFLDILLYTLNRFAGFDWLVLWVNVDPGNIPPNASFWGEVVDLINKFVPGELITIPGSLQLNKLQAFLGGSQGHDVIVDLDELGGHGEVAGGVATLHIFFGPLFGLVAAGVWLFALLRVERSNLHALHKVYIYQAYIQTFIVGGGFILMQTSLFWYLIVSVLIAFTIRFISPVIVLAARVQHAR